MEKGGWTYIVASQRNGTLYTGQTNDLIRRIWEHKQGTVPGFTKKHDVNMLVYYERYDSIEESIQREKTIKKWGRKKKLYYIEQFNPEWKDLYEDVSKL